MAQSQMDRNKARYFSEAQRHVIQHRDTWMKSHLNTGLAWHEYAKEYGNVCDVPVDQTSGYYAYLHCHLRVAINIYRTKWSQLRGYLHSMTFNCLLRVLPTGVTPFQCAMLSNAWKAYESIGSLDRRGYPDEEAGGLSLHEKLLAIGHNPSLSADQRGIWENTVAIFREACLRGSNAPYPELRLLLEDIVEHIGVQTEQRVDQVKANSASIVLSEFLAMARVQMPLVEEALTDVFDPQQLLHAPVGFDPGPVTYLRHKVVHDQAMLLMQLENPQPEANIPSELVASLIEAQLVHRAFRHFATGVNNNTLRLISMTPITWHQALRTGVRLLRYPTGLNQISRSIFGFSPWYKCEISCTLGNKTTTNTTTTGAKKQRLSTPGKEEEKSGPGTLDSVFHVCLNEITCHKIFAASYTVLFREAYENTTRLMKQGDDNLCSALLHFFITKGHEKYSSVDPGTKELQCFDYTIAEAEDGSLSSHSIDLQAENM